MPSNSSPTQPGTPVQLSQAQPLHHFSVGSATRSHIRFRCPDGVEHRASVSSTWTAPSELGDHFSLGITLMYEQAGCKVLSVTRVTESGLELLDTPGGEQ